MYIEHKLVFFFLSFFHFSLLDYTTFLNRLQSQGIKDALIARKTNLFLSRYKGKELHGYEKNGVPG